MIRFISCGTTSVHIILLSDGAIKKYLIKSKDLNKSCKKLSEGWIKSIYE